MTGKGMVINALGEMDLSDTSGRIPKRINQIDYLIDGKMCSDGEITEDVLSPICVHTAKDNKISRVYLGSYPVMNSDTALKALDAAVRAYNHGYGEWPTMSVSDRVKAILMFSNEMMKKRAEVVDLLMWEIGKNISDSTKEFDRTIEYIRDTCNAMIDLERSSSRMIVENGFLAQIRRAPLGVVLCMGPFNYPLNETFTTLIPALIMGNTVVLKPAKYGVLLLYPILECFARCFPNGVVNTVYGDGQTVIGPIMESGKIDVLAFIGSSKVANILKKQHPRPNRLRTVSGLQAKNVGIVTKSANIDEAVKECVLGSLSFNGQRCTAIKLIFVHESIKNEFMDKFCKEVDKLQLGFPWQNVAITHMPEKLKVEKMLALIEDACGKGATVANNGGEISAATTIMHPVVLDNVNEKMAIWSEEQFGPVVPVVGFKSPQEPIEAIRNSEYGQQASIFAYDFRETSIFIDALSSQVSRINLNSQCQRGPDTFPFTGRKDSAEGTLSVSDALRVFSIRALVAAKKTEGNTKLVKDILKMDSSSFLTTDYLLM